MTYKPVLIILFWHHFHLRNGLKLNALIQKGILNAQPQSITRIEHAKFLELIKGEIDGHFIIDKT